jgi:hypothetical protein
MLLVEMAAARPRARTRNMMIYHSLLADFCLRRAVRAQASSDRQTSPVKGSRRARLMGTGGKPSDGFPAIPLAGKNFTHAGGRS